MPESPRTWPLRWVFNFYPAFRGTGARITYVSGDWREVRVSLPVSWRTRNYVGTIFGGSIYAAVDPFYMVMLIKQLGPDYVVWDKSATVQFKRPSRTTLCATFTLDQDEIEAIKARLTQTPSVDRVYRVDLTDRDGVVYASIQKTIYVRRKEAR